ncbi:MAG: metal-dependent hydrolase [Cardiobacteriaceae bacterium]|nr:metal-dependent hydrolase [Cardiobacteriaceae bacterium]
MITAHAAAGYIVARWLYRLKPPRVGARVWAWCGAVSGLLPDIDMLWFYVIDHKTVHHHRYLTHWPLLWLLCLLIAGVCWRRRHSTWTAIALLFAINGMVHMVLDTIVGDIWWLMPSVNQPFSFFTVTPRYQPWWLNFILHWTFLLELALWGGAAWLFCHPRRVE